MKGVHLLPRPDEAHAVELHGGTIWAAHIAFAAQK
jgi:hypothetical protein